MERINREEATLGENDKFFKTDKGGQPTDTVSYLNSAREIKGNCS